MAVDENAGLSDGQPCIFLGDVYLCKKGAPSGSPKGRAVKF
ncbi:hypothetical protein GGR21_002314 [Dysgonomonas hofstadii]|uniref:Uncharacterized protein n=1 Tax=Dysgonomonas hofstadii TaxID=637886 RepID=A0A840CVB1_9BACT|nr:hypothetical protein [Dysgonomonas hofstadii]